MAHGVFLRGVNVGGARTFRPAALARELAALGVASLGAAGTFAVREKAPVAAVRAAFAKRLPFETEILVVPGKALLDLVREAPFGDRIEPGCKPYVTVLGKRPGSRGTLPAPIQGIRFLPLRFPFALCVRRVGEGKLYPNELVERALGVPATTRGWDTVVALAALLRAT